MTDQAPPKFRLKQARSWLWLIVVLALAGAAALALVHRPAMAPGIPAQSSFGGPFTLVTSDGKPFSSASLTGKPYAIYFGFTRCGDVCPTILARMVKLRQQVGGDDKFSIVFVTIDPANDGPREVGQYAGLFNSPIIGLTGSQAEIDHVKKQFGIFAEPSPHPMPGKEMEHSAVVLLFDRAGKFAATIQADDPDSAAIAKLQGVVG